MVASILILLLACGNDATLTRSNPGGATKKSSKKAGGKPATPVKAPPKFDFCKIDDVSAKMTPAQLRTMADGFCRQSASEKQFDDTVLGYVTPWHNEGYDYAKQFTSKLDIVAPVWLKLVRDRGHFRIDGEQDIDADWMQELRRLSPQVKVLPRLIFEEWKLDDFLAETSGVHAAKSLAQFISSEASEHQFDGFVLEMWQPVETAVRRRIAQLVAAIGDELHRSGRLAVLVVPPCPDDNDDFESPFDAGDFHALADHIDFFSLMTYDYSVHRRQAGPSAPIGWMERCVESIVPDASDVKRRRQLLLGLNFYGFNFNPKAPGAVIARDIVERLDAGQVEEILWDGRSSEHVFHVAQGGGGAVHQLFYPTRKSISERVRLAQQLGTGISIWELGQGMRSFLDFL